MAQGVCKLLWLQKLLKEMRLSEGSKSTLYCDNKAAISIAHNPVQHDRTKHVEIDGQFIKEKLINGVSNLFHVSSEKLLADVFIKDLNHRTFHVMVYKLGKCDIFAPT